MATRRMKPFRVFVPITRIDDSERVVEGYCYCNEEVGDGVRLTRSAMERAAKGYMEFPAVREMHQPLAAGRAQAVEFDRKGAYIRAKIVDDQAWRKVKDRVYRGFSVGIRARVMRGNRIESCDWIENSLVDRPADPDAVFTLARAEGADMESESEVDLLSRRESARAGEEDSKRGAAMRSAGSELARLRKRLRAAKMRIRDEKERARCLQRLADARAQPVRYPEALERRFGLPGEEPRQGERVREEIALLEQALASETDPQKRHAGIVRLQQLKMDLAQQ